MVILSTSNLSIFEPDEMKFPESLILLSTVEDRVCHHSNTFLGQSVLDKTGNFHCRHLGKITRNNTVLSSTYNEIDRPLCLYQELLSVNIYVFKLMSIPF